MRSMKHDASTMAAKHFLAEMVHQHSLAFPPKESSLWQQREKHRTGALTADLVLKTRQFPKSGWKPHDWNGSTQPVPAPISLNIHVSFIIDSLLQKNISPEKRSDFLIQLNRLINSTTGGSFATEFIVCMLYQTFLNAFLVFGFLDLPFCPKSIWQTKLWPSTIHHVFPRQRMFIVIVGEY